MHLASHRRLTPSQALIWLRERGAHITPAFGAKRWDVTWNGRVLNLDHAALTDLAQHDRAQVLSAAADVAPVTIALVACVGRKLPHAAPARDLYTSPWFAKARRYAEQAADRWYILSAHYGLVAPDEVRAPYDATLNQMPVDARRAWAARVWPQLRAAAPDPHRDRIVVLAGDRYRADLAERLLVLGYDVDAPMRGLGIGEQLAWLDAAVARPRG